jgi:hypothetical protein
MFEITAQAISSMPRIKKYSVQVLILKEQYQVQIRFQPVTLSSQVSRMLSLPSSVSQIQSLYSYICSSAYASVGNMEQCCYPYG